MAIVYFVYTLNLRKNWRKKEMWLARGTVTSYMERTIFLLKSRPCLRHIDLILNTYIFARAHYVLYGTKSGYNIIYSGYKLIERDFHIILTLYT